VPNAEKVRIWGGGGGEKKRVFFFTGIFFGGRLLNYKKTKHPYNG